MLLVAPTASFMCLDGGMEKGGGGDSTRAASFSRGSAIGSGVVRACDDITGTTHAVSCLASSRLVTFRLPFRFVFSRVSIERSDSSRLAGAMQYIRLV